MSELCLKTFDEEEERMTSAARSIRFLRVYRIASLFSRSLSVLSRSAANLPSAASARSCTLERSAFSRDICDVNAFVTLSCLD